MTLTAAQRISRLNKRLIELEQWTVRKKVALDGWTFDGAPIAQGAPWPTREGVVDLPLPQATVPADWPLDETRLELDLGGEGLVRIAYAKGGTARPSASTPTIGRFQLDGAGRFGHRRVRRAPALRRARPRRAPAATRRWSGSTPALADFVLLLRQVAETASMLGDHEAVAPHADRAAEACLRRARLAVGDAGLCRARAIDAPSSRAIWQLPDDLPGEPGGPRPTTSAPRSSPRTQACAERLKALAERYPQQGGLARHRPRPYRSRLAVAA